MKKIIYDVPMGKFLQEYFEKRLMYDISIGIYPNKNDIYNAQNIYLWIKDVQSTNFNQFLVDQSVHQANNNIVHFEFMIFDSKLKEHKFNIWIDIQQTIRKKKLNKIISNIEQYGPIKGS